MALSGTHHVRALKSALHKARRRYWQKIGDLMEVRAQTLKLREWGNRHLHGAENGILDLTYESIKSMPSSDVYELRLEDEIGGHRNIRVVFLVPPSSWKPNINSPLPMLWVLETLPKKRNEWTSFDIERFWALRDVVKERFYQS